MKYKVLVLGWKINDWKESNYSVTALGYNIFLSFKKIKNIDVYYCDKSEKDLPVVDFVVLIVYRADANDMDFEYIREKTSCKKIVSIRETPFHEVVDHSFVMNELFVKNNEKNTTYIPFPYNDKLLKCKKKQKKTILIDHYWESFLNTEKDWTFRIQEWLEDIKNDGYKIYRMIRFKGEEKTLKDFEEPIFYSNYLEYLENTSKIENYVITHTECYPHGVVDMVSRGTRVLTPPDFIPECMVKRLDISVFRNKEEFLNIVTRPLEKKWNNVRNNCTGFDKVVKILEKHFDGWMQ